MTKDSVYPIIVPPDSYKHSKGLTKLEYFTAMALQGICANSHTFWNSHTFQGEPMNICQVALQIGKEMCKQLEELEELEK